MKSGTTTLPARRSPARALAVTGVGPDGTTTRAASPPATGSSTTPDLDPVTSTSAATPNTASGLATRRAAPARPPARDRAPPTASASWRDRSRRGHGRARGGGDGHHPRPVLGQAGGDGRTVGVEALDGHRGDLEPAGGHPGGHRHADAGQDSARASSSRRGAGRAATSAASSSGLTPARPRSGTAGRHQRCTSSTKAATAAARSSGLALMPAEAPPTCRSKLAKR